MFFAVIGAILIIGISGFVIWLFVSTAVNNRAQPNFYKKHALVPLREMPAAVREALGAEHNPTCRRGDLPLADGGAIPFYWWQWYTTSRVTNGDGSSRPSYQNFLAVSFPLHAVSAEFEQKVRQTVQKDDFSQKFVNALVVDSRTPVRAEKLADGSFLICWQVSEQVGVWEEKILWLKNNVAVPAQAKNIEKIINRALDQPPEYLGGRAE